MAPDRRWTTGRRAGVGARRPVVCLQFRPVRQLRYLDSGPRPRRARAADVAPGARLAARLVARRAHPAVLADAHGAQTEPAPARHRDRPHRRSAAGRPEPARARQRELAPRRPTVGVRPAPDGGLGVLDRIARRPFAAAAGRRVARRAAPHRSRQPRHCLVRLGSDGRSLYFAGRTDAAQNLWQVRVDPDTLAWIDGPVRLTTSVALESDPAISPDGRRLLFSSRIDRTQVWALPLDHVAGRIVGPGEPVTPPGVDTDVLDFSADGRLAYSMERGRGHELWVRTADRRYALIRAEAQATILQPRWSPDGSRLVYYSGNPVPRVVLLDAEKGTARPLEAPLEPSNVFAWSPDGSSLIIGCPTADHP